MSNQSASTGEEIHDSPTGWVAKHIDEYVATGGEKGHDWQGVPTLLLTTRGRKSGLLRRSALIYGRDGDSYVTVGSNGGADHHPLWISNLEANPRVEIQVGPDVFSATATITNAAERPDLWEQLVALFKNYAAYQAKTSRVIPLVILTPDSAGAAV